MTAPLVIWLGVPGVHRLTNDAGSDQRQLNVPSWAWAASWGAASGAAGSKLRGR